MSTNADREILLAQYHEAHEMQRKLLELFWQESSVIIAIAGAVVVAAYYYITDAMISECVLYQMIRSFLVIFGTLMSFASVQTAIKHRFWRIELLDKIKEIENNLGLTPLPLKRELASKKFKFYEKASAECALIRALAFLTFGFLMLPLNIFIAVIENTENQQLNFR
ncbi:MAG: hypothetical protein ACQXXG_08980 [Candidatus Bathyarchaeia archaeon]|jgi:hypothetical protein